MENLKGKRILILQQRGWGKTIGRALAKRLYNRGCRLAAFTFKKSVHAAVLRQKAVDYDLIINYDAIAENPQKFLSGDNFSLEEICDELGVDSVWQMVLAARYHAFSYKDRYYYSFRQNMPDEQIVDYIKAIYKCAQTFFKEFKPDIIIGFNFVLLPYLIFNLYAEKHGVVMFSFFESKIQGINVAVEHYNINKGPFFDRLDLLNKGVEKSGNIERARQYIEEFKRDFKKIVPLNYLPEKTLFRKFKDELFPYLEILRWLRKRPTDALENIGPTPDNRSPKIILRDYYSSKRYRKFMEKFHYYPFENLNKFVYFPLQWQPEILLEVNSPYVSNQIETARQAAMSLPGDYTLAVKEHPGMIGRRTPSYIEKLARTPNVKVIDYRLPNETILKKAGLIISPGGTTLVEAAFLKEPKPVIQMGNMGMTLCLPNVFKHTDITTLAAKIREALKLNLNTKEYQRNLENYVAAAFDVGHKVDFRKMWKEHLREDFVNVYIKEIERITKKQIND